MTTEMPGSSASELTPAHAWHADTEMREIKLTFAELMLIYKALQAVRTLDALPPQDELLNDTIELVDRALTAAVR